VAEQKRTKVLVVEDDDALLAALITWLNDAGFCATGANTYEAARATLDHAGPDVLLTDIRLGAYNGLQLIIRARSHNPYIRAVVMTGYPDPVVRREAERLHAGYLEKPFDPDGLVDAIRAGLASQPPALERDRGAEESDREQQ